MKISSLIGKEIIIDNNWAGESFKVNNINTKYFIIRTCFGSGVNIAWEITYAAKVIEDNCLQTAEVIKNEKNIKLNSETIRIIINKNNEIELFINNNKIKIIEIKNTNDT